MTTTLANNVTAGTATPTNHHDIPSSVLDRVDLIFGCFLINAFSMLGLVGTGVNIYILSKYNITTDSSNILLVSLSVADFLFCLTLPFSYCGSWLSRAMDPRLYIKVDKLGFQYSHVFGRIVYCTSITLVGVISAERCLVVFFPFRAPSILTPLRMKILAVSVYVVNFALFSPLLFSFETVWVFSELYQEHVPLTIASEFYLNNYDAINFEVGVIYNNTVLGTSMLLTLALTPATAVKLWHVTNNRAKLTMRKCSFEPQVAKIFITVCTLNLIIYGPFICFDTAVNFLSNYSLNSNSFRVFVILTDFSGTLSASVNFIIYVSMSKKFKDYYKSLCSDCCRDRRNKPLSRTGFKLKERKSYRKVDKNT